MRKPTRNVTVCQKQAVQCTSSKVISPVVKASFILIAQKGLSVEAGSMPISYELKAILKKGAMVTSTRRTFQQLHILGYFCGGICRSDNNFNHYFAFSRTYV